MSMPAVAWHARTAALQPDARYGFEVRFDAA
jgi:hypothetical protein